jgi:three-Cys-motif partner protein
MALKNINAKKIYIDAFAGSGVTHLKNGETVDGSASIALNLDFNRYCFIEIDATRIKSLHDLIDTKYKDKKEKCEIIQGDFNEEIGNILEKLTIYDRAVMFLDPYALELEWAVLDRISACSKYLDIWYLFPFMAITRLLNNKFENIDEKNKTIITKTLGTTEWEKVLYKENPQQNFFGEDDHRRNSYLDVAQFIKDKLKTMFAYVSDKSKLLLNSKNAPMFLLLFMMTNKSEKAIKLGSRVVNDIFKSISENK